MIFETWPRVDPKSKLEKFEMLTKRIIVLLLFLALILAAGVGLRYSPDQAWLLHNEDAMRTWVHDSPTQSFLVGIVIYTGLSMIPGTSGKSVIFGWLYGWCLALIMVEVGYTAAALISFLISRHALRPVLQTRWQHHLDQTSERFEKEGAFYLLVLRLAHAPYTLVNYAAGATRIPFNTFWWTTHLGILPGVAVFTLVGARIPTLAEVVDGGVTRFLDGPLLFALIATFLLPILLRPAIRTMSRRNEIP